MLTSRVDLSDFSRACGTALAGASGSSHLRVLLVRARVSCSSEIGMDISSIGHTAFTNSFHRNGLGTKPLHLTPAQKL